MQVVCSIRQEQRSDNKETHHGHNLKEGAFFVYSHYLQLTFIALSYLISLENYSKLLVGVGFPTVSLTKMLIHYNCTILPPT